MVDVTLSIVNWNTRDELLDCLKSVFEQDGSVNCEVIVVDNASTDCSTGVVESEYPQAHLIRNDQNLGFGAAHNQSIKESSGRYVMLVNPDCRMLEPNVLRKMVDYMDAHVDVGILGPKVLNPDGSLQYSARHFPTMVAAVFRHTIFGKLFPNNRFVREYLMTNWAHDAATDVDWLSGSALMVRRETFEQIGLLDERFFMYCEDIDWCRRAHEGGWRVVYFPMASVSHRIGAASDKNPIPMIKQHHRSMLRYFLKYDSRSPRILLYPVVMVGLWLRSWSLVRRARP
ncbi:MAG: glycosyltransferase family 2 protein [Armatimonadetes bacterium]|nr:glycosyltransferase family 2 protein [Armatimonadota bacterium]